MTSAESNFKADAAKAVNEAMDVIQDLRTLSIAPGYEQSVVAGLLNDIQDAIDRSRRALLERRDADAEDSMDQDEESELDDIVQIPLAERRVHADKNDRSIDELHKWYREGDLILQPEFQRHYVWDDRKASMLVESVFLEVPLPVIYLCEKSDGKYTVIDGQQRLISLFRFLGPVNVMDSTGQIKEKLDALKLRGLGAFREYNERTYQTLPKDAQKKFLSSTLRVIEIRADSHPDVQFEIFERLNRGSVGLNDQELRNCIYRGRYNEIICDLASDKTFMTLLGLRSPHPRMADRQLVLRFLAFYHRSYGNYGSSSKKFMNDEMRSHAEIDQDEERKVRAVFRKSTDLAKSVFGERCAFRRFSPGEPDGGGSQWGRTVNRALFDVVMYGFTKYEKNQVIPNADAIREELMWLMVHDEEFEDSILFHTDKTSKVKYRFDTWLRSLELIIGESRSTHRNFSIQFKEQLWRSQPMCRICNQKIHDFDDAEVDHIKHYWRGGATVPSNARLTHRYCNRARGPRV